MAIIQLSAALLLDVFHHEIDTRDFRVVLHLMSNFVTLVIKKLAVVKIISTQMHMFATLLKGKTFYFLK